MRNRSPNLDGARVAAIVDIARRLPGRPKWKDLIEAVRVELGFRYSRGALFEHDAIRLAMRDRREGQGALGAKRPVSKAEQERLAAQRRLRAENQRLREQVDCLIEKHVRWAYNAIRKGLTEEDLDRELPRINRV